MRECRKAYHFQRPAWYTFCTMVNGQSGCTTFRPKVAIAGVATAAACVFVSQMGDQTNKVRTNRVLYGIGVKNVC